MQERDRCAGRRGAEHAERRRAGVTKRRGARPALAFGALEIGRRESVGRY